MDIQWTKQPDGSLIGVAIAFSVGDFVNNEGRRAGVTIVIGKPPSANKYCWELSSGVFANTNYFHKITRGGIAPDVASAKLAAVKCGDEVYSSLREATLKVLQPGEKEPPLKPQW